MISRTRLVVIFAASVLITGCQQAVSPTSTPWPTPLFGANGPQATPIPETTPTPAPALVLENVGATASATGFLALAVINNPSAQTATDVTVEITAVDRNGQPLARRSGSVRRITPGERAAVALPFPVGRTLPARFSGSITVVRWSADGSADVAQVAEATFLQDARTPTVRAHVVNRGAAPDRVSVTAVCWDAAGNIRGGGTRTVMISPGSEGHDVMIAVAISTPPARCNAYGVSIS